MLISLSRCIFEGAVIFLAEMLNNVRWYNFVYFIVDVIKTEIGATTLCPQLLTFRNKFRKSLMTLKCFMEADLSHKIQSFSTELAH